MKTKTKKGNTAMITLIVVIVAITFAVIGFLFAKKAQAPTPVVAQPVATQPITQQPTQQVVPINDSVLASEAGPKLADYSIKNLKATNYNPAVNEQIWATFEIFNSGQNDLSVGDYDVSLNGANMLKDETVDCDTTKILKPNTGCTMERHISYSETGDYEIAVSADNNHVVAESNETNNKLAIAIKVKPALEVLSPNGGEKFVLGSKHKIKWKINNSAAAAPIKLVVFDSNANGYMDISDQLNVKKGYYEWTLPQSFDYLVGEGGKDYKIRIINLETGDPFDESDAKFSIVKK